MPRKPSTTLTEAELRLMNILWDRSRGTVAEVVQALPTQRRLAYTTVLTTLRILERKGYLEHETQGRAYVYRPVVDRRQARRSALRRLMGEFFEGSPELLVLNLLEADDIDASELDRIKKMIAAEQEDA